MGKTNIAWCDFTFNPWIGCTKVSPGCANCYAAAQDKLRKWTPEGWGKDKARVRTSEGNWKQPLKWNRDAGRRMYSWNTFRDAMGTTDEKLIERGHIPFRRPRVFCASLADWLDDEVPIEWLADLLKLIHDTPNLDWLLLTKRPEKFDERLDKAFGSILTITKAMVFGPASGLILEWLEGGYPENVWVGTSVENQEYADKRIPALLKIPAKVRFLSCEPLLGPLKFELRERLTGEGTNQPCAPPTWKVMNLLNGYAGMEDWKGRRIGVVNPERAIHWVICGGESGGKRREMKLEWAESLRGQCRAAKVPFFFKQRSGFKPGCVEGVPAELMVQEFPG